MCSPCKQPEGARHDLTSTPLVRMLESILVLSEDEKDVLRTVNGTIKSVGPRQDLVREGDRPSECCLVLEGFAYRYKLTEDGKRQIFSFHIPGDIPDLQSLHLDVMDHSLSSLSACKVMFIPHETVRDLDPALSAHWRCVLARYPDRWGRVPRVDPQCWVAARLTGGWPTSCVSCTCASRPWA